MYIHIALLLLLFLRTQNDIIQEESSSKSASLKLKHFTEDDFLLGEKVFPVNEELCKTITNIEVRRINSFLMGLITINIV